MNTHWFGKSSPLKYTVNRKNKEGILVRTIPNSRMNQAIVNDKILHSAAAKLADVCGNEFGTKMHVGTLSSNNENVGTSKLISAGYAMKTTAAKECYKKKSKK